MKYPKKKTVSISNKINWLLCPIKGRFMDCDYHIILNASVVKWLDCLLLNPRQVRFPAGAHKLRNLIEWWFPVWLGDCKLESTGWSGKNWFKIIITVDYNHDHCLYYDSQFFISVYLIIKTKRSFTNKYYRVYANKFLECVMSR